MTLLEQKSRTWASLLPRSTGFALASSRRRSSPLVASPLLSRAFNALRAPHPLVSSFDGAQLPSVFNMQHIARRRRRRALRPAGAQAESIVPKRSVALSSDGPLCMRIFAGSRDSHPDVTSRRRRGCVLSAGPTQPESVRIRPMAASSVVERLLLRISCVQRGSATGCALHAAVDAPTTRCTLHAAVDAPTAASVVDAMRGGGAYWGSLCACELFY